MYINLNRNLKLSLSKQIYSQIKIMILNNSLQAGKKLPSSRKLADDLQVSRIVVLEAYEALLSEGYTVSIQGSGNFINDNVTIERPILSAPQVDFSEFEHDHFQVSFMSRLPALDLFPTSKWIKCYHEALHAIEPAQLGYTFPSGDKSFRKVLSNYLFKRRGIRCHEDQILVTSGSVQGLSLLARYFRMQSGSILMEDPFNYTIRDMFSNENLNVIYQSVDEFGINPNHFPDKANISGIITTPSHQYPMGGYSPISRRIEIIRYAREHNCLVVEDDYDSAYRFSHSPIESLHELDSDRVIYLDSFSKTLVPGLRIGYMVLPPKLIEPLYELKRISDIHCPILDQLAMKKFIEYGYLDQHILKMKSIYKKRRTHLIDVLHKSFGDEIIIHGVDTGIHIVVEFKKVIFDQNLLNAIASNSVYVMPLSQNSNFPKRYNAHLILGYGNLSIEKISLGVGIINKCISERFCPT